MKALNLSEVSVIETAIRANLNNAKVEFLAVPVIYTALKKQPEFSALGVFKSETAFREFGIVTGFVGEMSILNEKGEKGEKKTVCKIKPLSYALSAFLIGMGKRVIAMDKKGNLQAVPKPIKSESVPA